VNWKNVLRLLSVDRKSSRLIRGLRFRRFRENKIVTYALYIGALLLGLLVGWLIASFYSGITDTVFKEDFLKGASSLFTTLPTLALLYGLVFSQMGQMQRIGAKVSIQPLYWFPITWAEHTLASILANLVGWPLIISIFICSSISVASIPLGLVPLAAFTMFALLASLFLASVTTEVLKILQIRVSGALTKAAGRAAIWVRLVGSILFFVIFYLIYFSLYYSASISYLIEGISAGQRVLWFIPYLWLGIALTAFVDGLVVEIVIFSLASLAFIYVLFLAAVRLNVRFGLYEEPSIKVSRGAYVPRAGLLGRLGFSFAEAAIMRKDFKAFTRRRELMYIFIMPIVFIIIPIFSSMRSTGAESIPFAFSLSSFLFAYLTILPGTLMTVTMGGFIIGAEGASVWNIYSSPISPESLVKAKYSFVTLFSLAITLLCFVVAVFLTLPTLEMIVVGLAESILLVASLAMVSLTFGIKGADFRELPRPRMIRPLWSFVNVLVCFLLGVTTLSPMIPYGLKILFDVALPEYYLYVALPLSGVVASAVTYIFHRTALDNAEKFLLRAEV
jgi:hypothetical protein